MENHNISFIQHVNTSLPIINKLTVLYTLWQEYIVHFPKSLRFTLGGKIDSLFLMLLELIYTGYYQKGESKLITVKKAIIKVDLLKFFLKIAWEIKCLDNNKYAFISENLDEIGKMLGGWLRQLKTKLPQIAEE